MTGKKKLLIALGVVLAVALVAGLSAVAATTYGTKDDPLVTLSYLKETVSPEILAEFQDMLDEKSDELTETFDGKLDELRSKLSTSGNAVTPDEGYLFSVVTLSDGKTLACEVGTEIMLRIGSAVSAGANSPMLIDETTGESVVSAGTDLIKNHMYMVTIKDNGIKAASATVKVLVRGGYKVS